MPTFHTLPVTKLAGCVCFGGAHLPLLCASNPGPAAPEMRLQASGDFYACGATAVVATDASQGRSPSIASSFDFASISIQGAPA